MPRLGSDLWSLTAGRPEIDPDDLAHAVEEQAAEEGLDYRTRLLIRDSVEALRSYWGPERVERWLDAAPASEVIKGICEEEFERPGFPTIRRRLMEKTDPEDIRGFLEELGQTLHRPVRCAIGGSASLILTGHLSRRTEDIDVVDEVPKELRTQYQLLDRLRDRYGLYLAHFQSHYLPMGWQNRTHSLAPLGQLQVALVDVYDVFLSKLFSIRDKDVDDMRMLRPQLDKEILTHRLKDTTASMLAAEELRKRAEQNWKILYGEPLPT